MAEQEVIKHAKKGLGVWKEKDRSLGSKIREFIYEVLIIVFAVSLSIWLHGRSERSHQQQDVKAFLVGLRQDMENDITEMKNDRSSFIITGKAFRYLNSVKHKQIANTDSLDKYFPSMVNRTSFITNSGRYEGFKSAGKMGLIESKVLQNDILDLYEEDIPSLQSNAQYYNEFKQQVMDYYNANFIRYSDTTSNRGGVFSSDKVYGLSFRLRDPEHVTIRYDACIAKCEKIIAAIEKEYPEEK